MITEPALNSSPDNPLQISRRDIPIRIEAAIQVDYNKSDYYQITWTGLDAHGSFDLYFFLYDGCSQTECCKQPITGKIGGKSRSREFKTIDSACNIGNWQGRDGDDVLLLQLSSAAPTRYALVITDDPAPYHIPCTQHDQDYNYFYPQLPSTAMVGDPLSRSTCYEAPPASAEGDVLTGDVISYLGPFTAPAAINFKLTGWQTIRIYISTEGTYDIKIRQANPQDTACETERCSIAVLFDLFLDLPNGTQFISNSLVSSKAEEPCDRASWQFPGTQGYYLFSIYRNPAVKWKEDEPYVNTLFISPSGTTPFSGVNCTSLTYHEPCRRYFPPSTTQYIFRPIPSSAPMIQADNPTVFLVVTFVLAWILIFVGLAVFVSLTGCHFGDTSIFVVALDCICSPFDSCCQGYEQADLVKEGSPNIQEDAHVELEET